MSKPQTENNQLAAGRYQPAAASFLGVDAARSRWQKAASRWLVVFSLSFASGLRAQEAPKTFTHADTLRGSNTQQRSWWDVSFYDLHVKANPVDSSITGYNAISYRVLRPAREMQIDLQMPLVVDS